MIYELFQVKMYQLTRNLPVIKDYPNEDSVKLIRNWIPNESISINFTA